ncbi:MAG TPA: DUF4238 domain-containing protein, partial [Allosphingosinicella sp.]
MSVPEKHHYLPEFFMRRWADAEGLVREYRRPRRDLTSKRKAPAATGWIRNLYANENKADPIERQALEMIFMSDLDGKAADALSYIEEYRLKPPEWELRAPWSRFLELMIGSRRLSEAINWMHWRVHQLDKLEFGFISGDLPLMISNGLGHARSFLMLPIGPTRLFIASPDPNLINAF